MGGIFCIAKLKHEGRKAEVYVYFYFDKHHYLQKKNKKIENLAEQSFKKINRTKQHLTDKDFTTV